MAEHSLNNKIEVAWMKAREAQPAAGHAKREFQTRFIHVMARELDTTIERVRQRVIKIERRESQQIIIDPEALDLALAQAGRPEVRKTLILLGLGRYLDAEVLQDGRGM